MDPESERIQRKISDRFKLKRIELRRSNMPSPTDEEIDKLLKTAKDGYGILYGKKTCGFLRRRWWGYIYYLRILVPFSLGVRTSEAVFLQRGDFDLDKGRVMVDKAYTKSGEPKRGSVGTQPLNKTTKACFREAFDALDLKDDDFVLSGSPDYIRPGMLRFSFKEVAKATGLDPKRFFPYMGRYKYGTAVKRFTKDDVMAASALRHRDRGETFRTSYDRFTEDERNQAIAEAIDYLPPPPDEDSP